MTNLEKRPSLPLENFSSENYTVGQLTDGDTSKPTVYANLAMDMVDWELDYLNQLVQLPNLEK